MGKNICVIPARMGSSRFPGKPMAPLLGLPLILHVFFRCRLAEALDEVYVATCDDEIFECVENAGGKAVMTSDRHERCTDRVSEAIVNLGLDLDDGDLLLMVQGDEVLVSPPMINEIVGAHKAAACEVVNLVSRIYSLADLEDPNTVKVVSRPDGAALYFSRAPIPSVARAGLDIKDMPAYQQTGIIGFQAAFLQTFSDLAPTPLEKIESCDMMRVIEHGYQIQLVPTDTETIGVDTPADLQRAEAVLATDPITQKYLNP